MFDYRHKDLETGKLKLDKLTTLNSNTCLSDWVESGKEASYEYCARIEAERVLGEEIRVYTRRNQRPIYEVKESQREEKNRKRQQEEVKRIRALEAENKRKEEERQEKIRELEEYRVRLQIREEQLIKERQKRLAALSGGQRIITSKWNVR